MREVAAKAIESLIERLVISKPPTRLVDMAKEITKNLLKNLETRSGGLSGPLSGNKVRDPPCIKEILKSVENGENIPHFARFLLATYLITIGRDLEEIVSIFSKLPDFNEKITRYQVEHIAGRRGSGKRYLTPSCSKVQSMGFCFRDHTCANVKSPAHYALRNRIPLKNRLASISVKKTVGGEAKAKRKRKGIPEDEI